MNSKELTNKLCKLCRLQAGDKVYSKDRGWHTFNNFEEGSKYPIRCILAENNEPCYTMAGIWQLHVDRDDADRNISDVRYQARTIAPQPIGSAEVKAPFANARVGDMVWDSLERGYTYVVGIKRDDVFPIKTHLQDFDFDGTSNESRDIYWQAPTNNPPERPIERMTKDEFYHESLNIIMLADRIGKAFRVDSSGGYLSLYVCGMGAIAYDSETVKEQMDNIKDILKNKCN